MSDVDVVAILPEVNYVSFDGLSLGRSSQQVVGRLLRFWDSNRVGSSLEQLILYNERGVIHQMCWKMGIQSESSGRGEQRRLSIFTSRHKNGKKKEANEKPNKEKLKCVSFPTGADAILQDGDTAATSFNKYSGHSGKQGQWKDDFFEISTEEILEKVASLSFRLKKDKALKKIAKLRSKLPITSFRDAITSLLLP
ncbi:PREDICTED: DExH-box ATP-dependent RNA helicase DExH6 isoform X2 [Camelina sativa]|uniref:DExH-box ATP-dependent RNA helicase DExH6 isoform X2 n=1 Tax=Camelina sativa TaxID=90675 RepID=A0ABM1QYD5_CAMSA|nr:PREDICTED: DExH-box ATP-dependent RNA helicase DExH6 isoform X2 [Camelina sativa]